MNNYDTTQRFSMWAQGRDTKPVTTAERIGMQERQQCTFVPTPTKRTKHQPLAKAEPSPAQKKHFARLALARKKAQAKTDVPHATGKKWTGKTTVAKAPQLSCYRRKKVATSLISQQQASLSSASSASSASSVSSSLKSKSKSKRLSATKRGSFSSPRPAAKKIARPLAPASTYTQIHSVDSAEEQSEAVEYIPRSIRARQNNGSNSGDLADELVRLKHELQAEENRHAQLTAGHPAAPFAGIAPPAPPLGPPPATSRSRLQSPEPNENAYQLFATASTATRIPVPSVPLRVVQQVPQQDNHRRTDHYNLRDDRLSRVGLSNSENDQYQNNTLTSRALTSIVKNKTPNWKDIQESISCMMEKDIKKRKSMEQRLRSLEENNLQILGVNSEQFKKICGSDRKILSPAPLHRHTKAVNRSTNNSNNKHIQRMGKAMKSKLSSSSSKRTSMSKRGGALSRSSRGL
jgi:hypothetical protein